MIVTSYVFRDGKMDRDHLKQMIDAVGAEHLVLDLSCRKKENDYYIVTDRWQKFTEVVLNTAVLEELCRILCGVSDSCGRCGRESKRD